eukprot:jgi/Psemu1/4751/gm1.4751_g
MFRYDITESEIASEALEAISVRLSTAAQGSHKPSQLKLVSMRESYDIGLLTRFYNELMIPNFPLEEERDDLNDWVYCLDPAKNVAKEQEDPRPYPTMDVLLLIIQHEPGGSTPQNGTDEEYTAMTGFSHTVVAGIAFEYYREAQCGLLSYVVVSVEYRRLGIIRSLHPVACRAMQFLHQESLPATASNGIAIHNDRNHNGIDNNTIKAIFAETNTVEAGDASPDVIRKRHEILYQLGYRHLKFPYIQPALAEDAESFDDIMLLVYAPSDEDRTTTTTIETTILYDYVVDFFQSVTGYDNDSYKDDWYYRLVDWFRRKHVTTEITQDLPWDDVKQEMKDRMVADVGI